MRVWAFLVLMLVTVFTVIAAAELAERWFAPGFERGIVIAVIAALVVFPLTRWFEHKGWVKGAWRPGADGRPVVDPVSSAEADAGPASPANRADGSTVAASANTQRLAPPAAESTSPRPTVGGTASDFPSIRAATPAAHEPRSQPGDAR